MKIQCQNCGVEHEIDPPSWVVSSGRAFRFRCSSCGYSQSVQPSGTEAAERDTPAPPPAPRPQAASGATRAPEPSRPPPVASAPEPPPEPRGAGPTITPWEEEEAATRPMAGRVAHLGPSGPAPAAPDPGRGNAVFLKQNGQIYMVSDWDTLRRWVAESRVDRHDLVSEGGVRWDPIGSRPDLLAAFAGLDAVPHPPAADPAMFPFGGETPFGGEDTASAGWHDDDTEGIPTGLPPLPTDEVQLTGFDAATARPRNLTPTPPPVARRLPPPVLRQPTPVVTARAIIPPPTNPDEPVPPALPDTVPPPPVRATPFVPRVSAATVETAEPRVDVPITWAPVDEVPTEHGPPKRTRDHSDEQAFDDEPLVPVARSWWPVVIGGGITLGVLSLVVVLVGAQLQGQPVVPVPGPSLPAHPVDPDVRVEVGPDPAPAPEPVAPVPPSPVPDPVPPPPRPVPEPTPVPVPVAPDPQPAAPRPSPGRSVSSLVDRGWERMDRDPAGARAAFQEALAIAPADGDANFGYGYALLTGGSAGEAKRYLCKGLDSKNAETRREAQGVLDNHGLSCP